MDSRITRFMKNNNGGRNLGLKVNGISILIEATERNKVMAEQLAVAIASLGPAELPQVAPAPIPARAEVPAPLPQPDRNFSAGDMVWCNVWASRGWMTVTEVGTGRNHGRIKVAGTHGWCPVHNFDREPRGGRI